MSDVASHDHLFDLIKAVAGGDQRARDDLVTATTLLRVWDEGRSMILVTSDASTLYVGWFPVRGGGIAAVPLPASFVVEVAEHADGVFTLHASDGRTVAATWQGFHALVGHLVPVQSAQRGNHDLEGAFAHLRPDRSSGSATSSVAGRLAPTDHPYRPYFGYQGAMAHDGADVHVTARAVDEPQLRAMLPDLDRALLDLPACLAAARRFLVDQDVLDDDSMQSIRFSEIVYYDGGALDLCASLNAEWQDAGMDFLTVHVRRDGTPVAVSFG